MKKIKVLTTATLFYFFSIGKALLHADGASSSFQQKSPWLGNLYEFEFDAFATAKSAKKFDFASCKRNYHTRAESVGIGLRLTPTEDLDLSLTTKALQTKKNHLSHETTALAIRYNLLNDMVSDHFCLTLLANAAVQSQKFLKDINVIHHAPFETQVGASIGKELTFSQKEYIRTWATASLGIGSRGAAWYSEELYVSYTKQKFHTATLGLQFEQGGGDKKLSSPSHFRGYQNIAYKLCDVVARYDYTYESLGSIAIEAKRRVYAHFCPAAETAFQITLTIPFSL